VRRLIPSLALVVAVSASLAACGGGSSTSGTTIPTYKVKPAPQVQPPTTVINGTTYQVPTNKNGAAIGSYNDQGDQIIITDKGVLPYHLFVASDTPVTWTNLSSKPVSIASFYKTGPTSSTIPVGGTFVWPGAGLLSFVYKTSTGFQGIVQAGVLPTN